MMRGSTRCCLPARCPDFGVKRRRILAIGAVALLLAPATFLRDTETSAGSDAVKFTRLAIETPADWPVGLTLEQAWHLSGANPAFSGFSAMIPAERGVPAQQGNGFRLFSDRGNTALIPRPQAEGPMQITLQIPAPEVELDPTIRHTVDIEAAFFDQASGNLWLAYEYHNAVRRFAADGTSITVRPAQMQGWSRNSGAESMARLADGRFIILAERSEAGLLFANDPVDGGEATEFQFDPPGEFRPTSMALLPDGRALILLRAVRWQVPPFASMLVIADPADIRAGEKWPYEQLITFDQANLRDNYEAMLIEADGEGAAVIWLISDNNQSFMQRTLLLKLRWEYAQNTAQDSETARKAQTSGPLGTDQ